MKTEILSGKEGIERAAELIRRGEVVVFPTETVYGLGANAFDKDAVRKIFEVKGRPMDNPLIVHIADIAQVDELACEVSEQARKLMRAFMPGAITVIVKKSALIPDEVSAGLSTVGIRFPSHPVAQEFIRACGVPIAAPSANTSTKISPTTAEHVYADLYGKVEVILQGGACQVGIESTIVDMSTDVPTILRPGGITEEMLASVLGEVRTFSGKIVVAKAPGMKYKHYAPDCEMVVAENVRHAADAYTESEKRGENPVVLARRDYLDEMAKIRKVNSIDLGEDDTAVMRNIFAAMHKAQEKYGFIVCQDFGDKGVANSVMNRVNKASGGKRV